MAQIRSTIAGAPAELPTKWQGISIEVAFDSETDQPSITMDKFVWAGPAGQQIIDFREVNGPYEGPAFTLNLVDPANNYQAFTGAIDTVNDYFTDLAKNKVSAKIIDTTSNVTFEERAKGLTFAAVEAAGLFQPSDFIDCPYLVEPESDFIELALLGITIFLMLDQLATAIKNIAKDISSIAGELAGGLTGALGAVIIAVAYLVIEIIYAVLIIIYLKNLIQELIENLISPVRYFKGVTLRTLMEKGCQYIGYSFQSSIIELDYVYLPSQTEDGEDIAGLANRGIPQSGDFGYFLGDLTTLIRDILFRAKMTISDTFVVTIEPKNSSFWTNQSTYVLPDVLDEIDRDNAEELKSNFELSFELDLSDFYTVQESTGRAHEVITTLQSVQNPNNVLLKGFEKIDIPFGLATRKDDLSRVEELMKFLAGIIDGIINFFGGNSNFEQTIADREGMLKISNRTFRKPKIVPLVGGFIPANHRSIWSALVLYDKYHNERSFVTNANGNQYAIHKDITIPFSFANFLELLQSNFFVTPTGQSGKIENFKFLIDGDKAVVDYRIHEVFATNLIETQITEP